MRGGALSLQGLRRSFGGIVATNDVSLDFAAGSLSAIIGPNGAGKSTFISLLSGSRRPVSGQVLMSGRDVTRDTAVVRARSGIGRTFQINSLFSDISPLKSVALVLAQRQGLGHAIAARLSRKSALLDEACAILSLFGLSSVARSDTRQLAYGEQRLLEVALAYAQKPRILLLDEPVAGLTTAQGEALFDILSGLGGGISLLFIEHDMPVVYKYAERISVLAGGKILARGSADDIRANAEVRNAYLGT